MTVIPALPARSATLTHPYCYVQQHILTYSNSSAIVPCMSIVAAGLEILARAEAELRNQIERALSEGRYTEVAALARIADGLAQLATIEGENANRRVEVHSERSTLPVSQAPPLTLPSHLRRTRVTRTFPRFEREADKIVKIAWSKKDRAEYEHKAGRQVVDLLVDAIKSAKGEGARFDAPDILPLKDPKTRREVPSYQSYLALAWLRHEGVIVKYGRDGYALKPSAATSEHLSELWEALPSRG